MDHGDDDDDDDERDSRWTETIPLLARASHAPPVSFSFLPTPTITTITSASSSSRTRVAPAPAPAPAPASSSLSLSLSLPNDEETMVVNTHKVMRRGDEDEDEDEDEDDTSKNRRDAWNERDGFDSTPTSKPFSIPHVSSRDHDNDDDDDDGGDGDPLSSSSRLPFASSRSPSPWSLESGWSRAREPGREVGGGLLGAMVVVFDVRLGPNVVWSMGEERLTEEEVVTSMFSSGSHAVDYDARCFRRKNGHVVLSVFHRELTLDSKKREELGDRGASMLACGVICRSFKDAYGHLAPLKEISRTLTLHPNDTSEMETYIDRVLSGSRVPHPAMSYSRVISDVSLSFIRGFGVDIIRLWKILLSGLRVLFLASLPMDKSCLQVDYIRDLVRCCPHSPDILYSVSVSDHSSLASSSAFVACTVDRQLQLFGSSYDVIIDISDEVSGKYSIGFSSSTSSHVAFRHLHLSDHALYSDLERYIERGHGNEERSDLCRLFFATLNQHVMRTLSVISKSNPVVRSDEFEEIGIPFDPSEEGIATAICKFQNINVEIMHVSCCGCC